MLHHTLIALLAASQPVKLAAPPLEAKGVARQDADFFLEALAQALKSASVAVTTAGDFQAVLGLERQKQLLGCADSGTSCVAELANALGVDGVLRGSIGLLGGTYVVNLKILRASDGVELASTGLTAASERELLTALQHAATELRAEVLAKLRPGEAAVTASAPTPKAEATPARWLAAIPLALGTGCLVTGVVLLGSAEGRVQALIRGDLTAVTGSPEAFASIAKGERLAGQVLLGIGGASLVGALVSFLVLRPAPVAPVALFSPLAASFGLAGALP